MPERGRRMQTGGFRTGRAVQAECEYEKTEIVHEHLVFVSICPVSLWN